MSLALQRRLRRLERRLKPRPWPRSISGIYDKKPEEIIGYEGERGGWRFTVIRQPGEALESVQARAWSLVGAPWLATAYIGAVPAQEAVSNVSAASITETAPADPWELAGIGRRATRDELIRMGAIAMPPERPIDLS